MAQESAERQYGPKYPRVTPETLLADNSSPEAFEARGVWDDGLKRGEQPVISTCSDARVIQPNWGIQHPSIAAAGGKELHMLDQSPGSIVITHYDGSKATQGERPSGCGGQDALANLSPDTSIPDEHAHALRYVQNVVESPDPVINALRIGQQIAMQSWGIPVAAGIQDHITGITSLVGVFNGQDTRFQTAVPMHELKRGRYDPAHVYADGIPSLPLEMAPDFYLEYMALQRERVADLERRSGAAELHASQRVQQPRTLLITDDPRPAGIKYPDFGTPNSVFVVNDARPQYAGFGALDQAHYAISSALQNFGDPSKPFSSLKTIMVDTASRGRNETLLAMLAAQPFVRDYMHLPGTQILSGISANGTLTECSRVQI